jgi:hypothetical protein
MSWEAASVIVNTVLAIATLGIIYLNREQVKASQDQVRISREQLQQSQEQVKEALELSQRPFLFPTKPLTVNVHADGSRYFDFGQPAVLGLKNVGTGIALNIAAFLVQPRPQNDTYLSIPPRTCGVVLDTPLPPDGQLTKNTEAMPNFFGRWDYYVGTSPDNSVVAPGIQAKEQTLRVVARLTIGCNDILGNHYFGQFDLAGVISTSTQQRCQ